MNKLPLLALLFALLYGPNQAAAQTPAENLQSGVEIYNAMRTYADGITNKTITSENLDDIKARMEKGVALMDKVIKEGNSNQILAARYFRVNFKYEYGFMLGMKGENNKAYPVFADIDKEMGAFTAADFPMTYDFFDKKYTIRWENFAPTQAEYFTGMGEVSFNIGKYKDAVRFTQLGLNHPYTSEWLKYISVNKLIDIYNKDKTLIPTEAYLDYVVQSIKLYDALDEEYKKTVNENKYPTVKRGVSVLLENSKTGAASTVVARCAEAVPIAAKYETASLEILQMYDVCYKNNYNTNTGFDLTAQIYARNNIALSPSLAERVGVAATDHLVKALSPSDCDALQTLADNYRFWRRSSLATQYDKKAADCLKERAKAQKKAAKSSYSGSGNFNFYIGANILPLLNTNPKRDYGGVVDLVFKHSALEFGYTKINRNKENIFDLWIAEVDGARQDNLSPWDGYKAFIQPKFFTKGSDHVYTGILLGYNEKNFDPLSVSVLNDATGTFSMETFEPKATQLVGMINVGGMALTKGFGLDMFAGIGATYGTFDAGNSLDRSLYTIDNPLLEYRKEHYWGVVMRFGITMGLNIGKGF